MATTMHEVSMYCMARTERRGYLGARGGSLKSQKTTWGVLCAVDTPACQVYPHSTITYSFTSIDFQSKLFRGLVLLVSVFLFVLFLLLYQREIKRETSALYRAERKGTRKSSKKE